MGDILGYYVNWGILLQIGCVIHFVQRRPNTYWLWIILMFGPLGSLAYIFVEVIPDAGLLRGTFQMFPRRKRIRGLERTILDNPSSGNLEELADLYLEDGKPAKARELYDRAITPRTTSIDPYYRRGLAALALNDLEPAAADFSHVVTRDSEVPTSTAPRGSSPILARASGTPTRPRRGSSRRRPCRRRPSSTSTTRSSSNSRSVRRTPASGPGRSSTRSRRCPATCGAESAPGSAAPPPSSSASQPSCSEHCSEQDVQFLRSRRETLPTTPYFGLMTA